MRQNMQTDLESTSIRKKKLKKSVKLLRERGILSDSVSPPDAPEPPADPYDPCREQENAVNGTNTTIDSILNLVDTLPELFELLAVQEAALAQCRRDNVGRQP